MEQRERAALDRYIEREQEDGMTRLTMRYVGEDGNIFSIAGRAGGVLLRAGLRAERDELYRRVSAATSYAEALAICTEYVAPAGDDDEEDDE